MDDKTIIDITNLDAEKHAENAAKRVASYSEKLLHHASILSEKEYQKFLLERLEKDNGYVIRKASDFDRYFAVDREMLFKFLEDTQHETMEYLRKIYKSDLEETIVSFINAETTKTRGSLLDVLKHGIEISNQKLELMYTKPATTFNPDLTRKYGQNIFSAMEEVWASDKERIDVVIFLNGLAIIAFELKCNAAGQSYQDAIYQFRTDRSPKTRLFMFKAGTLVNFAMDLEEVYMTTKLAGDATFFLPFNMGNGEGVTAGAGNPAFEDKYSVSYMWEDILTKDTILDLISKFIFVETKEKVDDKTGKIKRSENLIFPRYHQLDVIRKVLADVRENRTAQNYLIQHSAGSGKTNSIAWLAHRLTSLHDEENKIIFDNIIIVTDRVVVDRQLQKAIMGMEHKAGLIRVMDDKCNSADLAIALNGNTKIIATTIQKFPYIVDSVKDLKNKSFAVIIDEAHSSTAGKDMAAVTMSLGSGDQTESDVEDMISSEIKRNGKQANVSIFAFTATPKPTTIQLFGRLNTHGQREAFHVYSMKQAIEEGFILDVLQNYTEYSTFYQLNKEIEDDPRCKTNAAKRQIARFIELHDTNIAQRVEVIVEHFRTTVMQELGGQAKAMVITASRQGAVKYRQAFEEYITKKGYDGIHALVAFSGKVKLPDDDKEYTEASINGFPEDRLTKEFDTDNYQGLYREYISRQEELSVMRGKINMPGTIKNRLAHKRVLTCDFDELSENNLLNQILKTTVTLLLRNGKVQAKYKDDLKKKMLYFSNVEIIEPTGIKWSSIRFQRNNQTYRMLVSICQLIIEGMLITTDSGDYRLASFVDEQRMCRLYEKFILEYYSRHYPELSVSASQIPWSLDDGIGTMLPVMQSDIHLQRGNTGPQKMQIVRKQNSFPICPMISGHQ